jgi:hypothetical protein
MGAGEDQEIYSISSGQGIEPKVIEQVNGTRVKVTRLADCEGVMCCIQGNKEG